MADENIFTYENLFEVLRSEKTKEDLQKLDNNFYSKSVSYLNEKRDSIKDDSYGSMERSQKEYSNIKKIIREIFDRRESKIIKMALNKARTDTKLISTGNMLREEVDFFNLLIREFSMNRKKILMKILEGQHPGPTINDYKEAKGSDGLRQDEPEEDDPNDDDPDDGWSAGRSDDRSIDQMDSTEIRQDAKSIAKTKRDAEKGSKKEEHEHIVVRFMHPVPKFVGKELEVYGPFEKDDTAMLPSNIADILIRKGRAELQDG